MKKLLTGLVTVLLLAGLAYAPIINPHFITNYLEVFQKNNAPGLVIRSAPTYNASYPAVSLQNSAGVTALTLDPATGVTLASTARNLKTWWDFEDFIGRISGQVGIWITGTSGTGAVAVDTAGTALRPGIFYMSTGTTTTGVASAYVGGATTFAPFLFGGGVYTIEADIYIFTLSDGTDTYSLRFGFGDSITGTPTDGAYFYYTDVGGGTPTPNWYRNTTSNTTITTTNTGVAAVAGAWTRLELVVNANASSVEYFINGTSVGSNTTNIPSGAGRGTGAFITNIKSAGTTLKIINIDWAWIHVDLTASR